MELDAKSIPSIRDWTFLQLRLQVHDPLDLMPAQSQDIQVLKQFFDWETYNHFILWVAASRRGVPNFWNESLLFAGGCPPSLHHITS